MPSETRPCAVTYWPKAGRADEVTDKCDHLRACCPGVSITQDLGHRLGIVLAGLTPEQIAALRAESGMIARVEYTDGLTHVLGYVSGRPSRAFRVNDVEGRYNGPINWGYARIAGAQGTRFPASRAVTIGIGDTGLDPSHPDLAGHIAAGSASFAGPDQRDWQDRQGHGTHVSGIALQVAPAARLVALKVLGDEGSGTWEALILACHYLLAHPGLVDALNLSLGGLDAPQALADVLMAVLATGVPIVAAAGNSNPWLGQPSTGNPTGAVEFPARFAACTAVSALRADDRLAVFSCRGPEIMFCAPGWAIPSLYLDGGYASMSGTSMAAPFVTGVAALALGTGLSLVQAAQAAVTRAEKLHGQPARSEEYGFGLLRPGDILANG